MKQGSVEELDRELVALSNMKMAERDYSKREISEVILPLILSEHQAEWVAKLEHGERDFKSTSESKGRAERWKEDAKWADLTKIAWKEGLEKIEYNAMRTAGLWVDPRKVLGNHLSGSLKQVFEEIDTDNSGDIDISELRRHPFAKQMDEAELEKMIASADRDHNGRVNFEEFLDSMAERGSEWLEKGAEMAEMDPRKVLGKAKVARFERIFKEIDTDQSGDIDLDELRSALLQNQPSLAMSEVDLPTMISSADRDHTGKVSFDEALLVMAHAENELFKQTSKEIECVIDNDDDDATGTGEFSGLMCADGGAAGGDAMTLFSGLMCVDGGQGNKRV